MNTVHCWTSRYEADGFPDRYDWVIEKRDQYPDFDVYSEDDGQPWFRDAEAICLLPEGHKRAHKFTPTREIEVTFPPLPDTMLRRAGAPTLFD